MSSQILFIIIAIICAYLIGSFPSGYIMGRLRKGIDIRDVGSRSMGAMNVFYKVGFAEGLLVLAIDIGKGAAAVAIARWLGVPMVAQLCAGAAAVIGHAFPVFLKSSVVAGEEPPVLAFSPFSCPGGSLFMLPLSGLACC
ncbi:glycerol-3-phosphate acyltransferase [Chloroflexota bacterium]